MSRRVVYILLVMPQVRSLSTYELRRVVCRGCHTPLVRKCLQTTCGKAPIQTRVCNCIPNIEHGNSLNPIVSSS